MHKLLERQLNRLNLGETTLPETPEQWGELLSRIDNVYSQADKERYSLERSMEISSREMMSLNKQLENAQHIAQLGYWSFEQGSENIIMSKELRHIFGVETGQKNPTFSELIERIHEDDRDNVRNMFNSPIASEGCVVPQSSEIKCAQDFEAEFQMLHPDGTYHWYYFCGHPEIEKGGVVKRFTGITMDIGNRKKVEQEVASLHEKLLVTARQAGMADISTSILHNVGNILNSVSVSLELLRESIENSKVSKFKDVCGLLENNMADIANYISQDPKGKLVPQYLIALSENVGVEYKTCNEEIENLRIYIEHIKEIVASQNELSGTAGMTESISIVSVVDTALKMAGTTDDTSKNIKFNKNYQFNKKVDIDKTKVMQILVNLFQNAKESVTANDNDAAKMVSINIEDAGDEKDFKIVVEDNGSGILPENITKIFSFGFSTKETGHGFGLHASALAAKEMGGKLIAESDGPGHGARFILTLPACKKVV